MNIVILDGHALNPGDLSWRAFSSFGTVTLYDRTPPELAAVRIGSAEILITNKVTITAEIMDRCPNLRYIGVLATGYNIIDTAAAAQRSITVTNIPSYSTAAVAQAVFALLLELTNGVHAHNESVHRGDWCASPDFCYWTHPLSELTGKTMGIIGFGDIGRHTAKIAAAFGLHSIASTRSPDKILQYNRTLPPEFAVEAVQFETLIARSDIISLHCPLTDATRNIISRETLVKVKRGAILINTARGPLVDECAVRDALDSGQLGGYAADVLSAEPMRTDNPLLNAPNCVLTPHVAWAAKETRQRLMDIAVENLRAYLAGTPVHTVSCSRGNCFIKTMR